MKKFSLIAVIISIVSITIFVWLDMRPSFVPHGAIGLESAQSIVSDIIAADADAEDLVAYLWPDIIAPGVVISTWDDETSVVVAEKYTYLGWIDRDPGNPFFAHETEFVYIDALTGEYTVVANDYWPVIGDVSFEGDISTMVTDATEGTEKNANEEVSHSGVNTSLLSWIGDIVATEAYAQTKGNKLRITADKAFAPTGEYYAVIIAGFGKNSWVFLDGAHQMYDALKAQGYDDDHIIFLGQGKAKLNPEWNRTGDPQLVKSTVVDAATSPKAVEAQLATLKETLGEKDSLFVFVLAHGKPGKITMGKPAVSSKKMSVAKLMKGRKSSMKADSLASALMDDMELCELMIMFDSCYAGSERPALESKYDPSKIKRLSVMHSSSDKTNSYGADYRKPTNTRKRAKWDLDAMAKKTPIGDTNPSDHGGEFSSGMIASLGSTVYSVIYDKGLALDAAAANKMTEPSLWSKGAEGACVSDVSYLQPPEGGETALAEEPNEISMGGGESVSVISYGDSYIPVDQMHVFQPQGVDSCKVDHWHANESDVVTLDGESVTDPGGCGYGVVSENPVIEYQDPI